MENASQRLLGVAEQRQREKNEAKAPSKLGGVAYFVRMTFLSLGAGPHEGPVKIRLDGETGRRGDGETGRRTAAWDGEAALWARSNAAHPALSTPTSRSLAQSRYCRLRDVDDSTCTPPLNAHPRAPQSNIPEVGNTTQHKVYVFIGGIVLLTILVLIAAHSN